MISHFFIDRPIFAAVLSIVITIMGTAALTSLPIAQYPDISPPTVIVTASYPGANAQTVLDTVAAPIEQQVSGVENMLYMSSQCANDGSYTLLVTFKLGMDANMAQVLVQNRVSLGLPNVPDLVQREGVAVKKISPSIMMIINMFSENLKLKNHCITIFICLILPPSRFAMNYFAFRAWAMSPLWANAITLCGHG